MVAKVKVKLMAATCIVLDFGGLRQCHLRLHQMGVTL